MTSISAIVPAFNAAGFISKAVDSIRNQTTSVDEIIVIDDGSTDNTAEVVRSLGEDIQFITQNNAGPSAARNRGIQAASGDLIAFLDADDQWTSNKIERQLEIFQTHPELALISADMSEINPQGDVLVPSVMAKYQQLEFFKSLDGNPIPNAARELTETNFIPTGTVLARRDALVNAGMFNQGVHYGEDLELWCKIALHHPIACLADVGMLRCQHGGNVTGHTLPLLRDLTKVMTNLRAFGARQLRQQDVDPDALVASAWANLGYHLFDEGDFKQSRMAFRISLAEQFSRRAFIYRYTSMLPPVLIRGMRKLKQTLSGNT